MKSKKRNIEELKQEKPDKVSMPILAVGILLIILAAIIFVLTKAAWMSILIIILGLLFIAIAASKNNFPRKDMSSEEWIYTGLFMFMFGVIVWELEVLRMIGFIYFTAGLAKRAIEKNNADKKITQRYTYAIIAGLIAFICAVIILFMLR